MSITRLGVITSIMTICGSSLRSLLISYVGVDVTNWQQGRGVHYTTYTVQGGAKKKGITESYLIVEE